MLCPVTTYCNRVHILLPCCFSTVQFQTSELCFFYHSTSFQLLLHSFFLLPLILPILILGFPFVDKVLGSSLLNSRFTYLKLVILITFSLFYVQWLDTKFPVPYIFCLVYPVSDFRSQSYICTFIPYFHDVASCSLGSVLEGCTIIFCSLVKGVYVFRLHIFVTSATNA